MTQMDRPVPGALLETGSEPLCARMPVHLPGEIQAGTGVFAFDPISLCVVHVSEGLETLLGGHEPILPGAPLDTFLDAATIASLTDPTIPTAAQPTQPIPLAPGFGGQVHVLADSDPTLVVVEVEPIADENFGLAEARSLLRSLRAARTVDDLCATAVRELRALTGYDRVMVYRFSEEGHGEVIAEDLAAGQEPYLGLRYPAGDIPPPVRRLFTLQRVRGITDAAAPGVRVLGLPGAGPLDMSWCANRGVAAVHREYVTNMGVRASLVLSLLCGGELWGMLVCHHRTPKTADYPTRSICDLVAQVLAMLLDGAEQTEAGLRAARCAEHLRRFTDAILSAQIAETDPITAIEAMGNQLLDMAGASGAVLRLRGRLILCGATPRREIAARLLDTLRTSLLGERCEPDGLFATNELARVVPELAPDLDGVAGALLVPIARSPGDALVWLRREITQTVRWGGNPAKGTPDRDGMLSPRHSFAEWRETVHDRSERWTAQDREAARELRRAVEATLVNATEAHLVRMNGLDPLTGLATRMTLLETMRTGKLPAEGRWQGAALIRIDLDRFGAVNELMGPSVGDLLLADVANRLRSITDRPTQTLARIGGDEFAIFWNGCDDDEVDHLARQVHATLRGPFSMPGRPLRVTAAIGYSVLPADPAAGRDALSERLLAASEVALRQARREGGDRVARVDDPRLDEVARRVEIEQGLRQALNEDGRGLELAFQPVMALEDSGPGLRGFEALLRWKHPFLGPVAPGEFIPIAEETGLIGAIGDWVLAAALRQLAQWRRSHPGRAIEVAVNVSPLQVTRSDFASRLSDDLLSAGVPAEFLLLEVTEGALADHAALASLAQARALGCKVSIDDFGTGFSSLSYLRRIPADEVKLDRTFLSGDGSPGAKVQHEDFLAALIRLARAAGLSVLAEGVETRGQLAALSAAGCDAAQGWLFGRAVPAEEAGRILAEQAAPAIRRRSPGLPFSFRDIVENSDDIVLVTDNRIEAPGPHIVYANPAFTRVSGYRLEEVLGRSPRILQGPDTSPAALDRIRQGLRSGAEVRTRLLNYTKQGLPYWLDLRIVPIRDSAGRITHFAAIERDVTEDAKETSELDRMAHADTLTGVSNRRGLQRFLDPLLAARTPAKAEQTAADELCIVYLDIDHFKQLNDTHGHAVGDSVLLGLADLLQQNIRRSDHVARIGGEEFVLCLPGIGLADGAALAERLRQTVSATALATGVGPLCITCSLGVTSVHPDETGIEPAIERADTALYRAKQAGRDRVVADP